MTAQRRPAWLADFQARFGSVLRAPLDRSSGTLTATPATYDREVGARPGPNATAGQRLAVYNRQYWFRLFEVFQSSLPLTTRLLGHWRFNDFAARFLLERPPRSWDIDRAPDGFEDWIAGAAPSTGAGVEPEALAEAARIDAAHRRVFRAPAVTPFRPSLEDAAHLLASRLVPSPAMAIFRESWPLLELRRALPADESEAPVPLPERLAQPRHFALVRRPEGFGALQLEPREAELLELLAHNSLAEALGRLEALCSEAERSELPERARRWLARSVELDFWIGREPP